MSALLYTLITFGLILVLARLKVPLWGAITAGIVAIGVFFGLGPAQIAQAALSGAIKPITVALVFITVVLLALSQTLRASGQLEQIVSLASRLLRRPAIAMAAMPALVGLLPMPGGALFSAPMVESATKGTEVDAGRLSAINYWFRHIWEYWWPLYPGVILATTLTAGGLGVFIAFQLPLTVFMVGGGLLIFRRIHPDLHIALPRPAAGTARKLLRATSPIWIIMIVWGAVTIVIGSLPAETFPQSLHKVIRTFVPIASGLLVSLFWTIRMNRLSGRTVRKILRASTIYELAVLVLVVMVFQFMLKHIKAADQIAEELKALHVPVVLVVAILPALAGMVTGLAIGFVGTSFPIVLPLIAAMPDCGSMRPYIVLAYACGHMGMMLSPIHLCHVVSNRYFKTGYAAVYRHLVPSAIVTVALAVAYVIALRLIMG